MAWITPDALGRARGHVARIAARLKAVGIGSSTLTRLQKGLSDSFPADGSTGRLVLSAEQVAQLQSAAADLETVLREGQALHLGDFDLPQLRYLLSEEVVG